MGHNDVTGDKLISKEGNKKAFDEGWERIFNKESKDKLAHVEERKSPCQLHDACSEENTCACSH